MDFKLWLENQAMPRIVSYDNIGNITLLIGNNKYSYQTENGGYVGFLYRKYYKLGFLPWPEYNKLKKISKSFKRIDQPEEVQKELFK